MICKQCWLFTYSVRINSSDLKTKIKDFEIPDWNKILELSKKLAKEIKEAGIIGWDIALTTKGIDIVEGNSYPGHDIYQLPPHRTNNIGVLPRFEKYLK